MARQKKVENEVPEDWMNEVRIRAAECGSKNWVERIKPQIAARALWMLAQGCHYLEIREATGLDRATVKNLEWRHTDTLESKRKQFSRRYAQVAEEFTSILFTKAERLADNPALLDAISPDKLALTVGIMTDKAAMLSGMANSLSRSTSRDLEMSQFWQNLQPRLQPAVPNDSTGVPGKK